MNDNDNNSYSSSDASAHYESGYSGDIFQPAQPSRPAKRGMGAGAVISICLICSILAAALGVGGTYLVLETDVFRGPAAQEPVSTSQPLSESQPSPAPAGERPVAESASGGKNVYDLAKQQVVGVTTEISYVNIFGQISPSSVTGTGFVISEDGYIMTNNHVISEAVSGGYEVSVLTYDGTEYTAQIVGHDAENDIAVLKIDASGLVPAVFGDSDGIAVGQEIYAVGNPLGELNFTMTTGIVSATDRAITTDTDSVPINMFQIDAAVNNGNSGGPVYNTDGQVVGVVTAKTSATGVEGLGFAIPINDASHVAEELIAHGYVTGRASLGVSGYPVPSSVAERYGMVPGALVSAVNDGGAAAQAGIREGDIITAVDGREVVGFTELTAIVRSYAVGDTAQVTVWRNGETLDLPVTFGESAAPADPTPAPQQDRQEYQYYGDLDDFFRRFFGSFGF